MHSIRVDRVITLMISFFYLVGIWHRGDKPTAIGMRIKLFYCVYFLLFPVSAAVGIITNENPDQTVFLAELGFATVVLYVKLWILIWNQDQLLDLLNRVCSFSIRDDDDFTFVNNILRGFINFVVACMIALVATALFNVFVAPFLKSERSLFLEIAFPLDYKHSDIGFWSASVYILSEWGLGGTVTILSAMLWYLLLNSSLRYQVLGNEMKKLGKISEEKMGIMPERQKHTIFLQNLTALIDNHLYLKQLIDELGSFSSNLFLLQFATSGICICGSTYCLAFGVNENLWERLVQVYSLFYYTCELFMVTYLGNEIMLSSNRLSYSLFESDWYDQPQSTRKCIIVFGEYLKQPQELLIGKLYPLTLETFTRILNSAYSMFNILKNFKE